MATPQVKAAAMLLEMSDRQIMDAAEAIDTQEVCTPAERMVYAWLMDEIERRHPDLDERIDDVFATDFPGTYREAVLVAAGRIGLVL